MRKTPKNKQDHAAFQILTRARSKISWVAVALAAVLTLGVVTGCAPSDIRDGGQAGAPAEREDQVDPTNDAPSDADLDAYAAKVTRAANKQFGSFNGMYSEIRVDPVYPNSIEYVYVFAKPVVATAVAMNAAKFKPTLQTMFDTAIAPEMEALGFSDPTATYKYLNPDGSLVWTHTFDQS